MLENRPPMGITDLVTNRVYALANTAAYYAYPPLTSLSRTILCYLFSRIKVGHLTIIESDGTTTTFGNKKLEGTFNVERSVYSIPEVELRVHRDIFWLRMLLFADMV